MPLNSLKKENRNFLQQAIIISIFAMILYANTAFNGFVFNITPEKPIDWYRENFDIHCASMLRVYGIYFTLFICPIYICVDQYIDPPVTPYDVQSILTVCILLQILIFGIWCYLKKWKGWFALLWIALCISPVAGFFPIRHAVSERYLYIPLAGFSILVACLLVELDAFIKNRYPSIKINISLILLLIITFLGGSTVLKRNAEWKDEEIYT